MFAFEVYNGLFPGWKISEIFRIEYGFSCFLDRLSGDDLFNKFVHAVIVEKKNDHCLALTEGNENPGQNDLMLWIDEDTEMYFFDEDMLRTLSREL